MIWLQKRISYRLVLSVEICIIGIQNADYVSNANNNMNMLFIDDQSVWTCTKKKDSQMIIQMYSLALKDALTM